MSEIIEEAKEEIQKSLILVEYCMRTFGLSFAKPTNRFEYWKQKSMFVLCMTSISYHIFGDIVYMGFILTDSARVEDVVPLLHTFGFGVLSMTKLIVLWYKIDVFRDLLIELAEIWPMPPLDEEYQAIKNNNLSALLFAHRCYSITNLLSFVFFCFTPIVICFYQRYWLHEAASIGFVWNTWYPFNKNHLFGHVVAYIYEMFIGQICVGIMVCIDLFLTGMASHIGLLLRLLHRRVECIGSVEQSDEEHYEEIKGNIKLHQRLIKYCNDLRDAFSFSNFANVIMSSVNICCVLFVIVVLEPMIVMSNKMFLTSALLQIGIICWYADDIFHASKEVADAAYRSKWYVTSPRCRRAVMFLIMRAQKPIAFTAMNFTDMTLVTYTAIMTRSYSYFALLYTMYRKN